MKFALTEFDDEIFLMILLIVEDFSACNLMLNLI